MRLFNMHESSTRRIQRSEIADKRDLGREDENITFKLGPHSITTRIAEVRGLPFILFRDAGGRSVTNFLDYVNRGQYDFPEGNDIPIELLTTLGDLELGRGLVLESLVAQDATLTTTSSREVQVQDWTVGLTVQLTYPTGDGKVIYTQPPAPMPVGRSVLANREPYFIRLQQQGDDVKLVVRGFHFCQEFVPSADGRTLFQTELGGDYQTSTEKGMENPNRVSPFQVMENIIDTMHILASGEYHGRPITKLPRIDRIVHSNINKHGRRS